MANITNDDVAHLATLSQIALSPDEMNAMREDLGNILKYIEQLDDLDTSGVEPTYQVTGLQNVFRNDDIQPHVTREKLLDLAPDVADNQMKVPKVL